VPHPEREQHPEGLTVALRLRRADFSLSDEQRALRESFASFLTRECPAERVRKAEPLGFDERLWGKLVDLGAVGMGVPEAEGGDGAGLVELALVAEQVGRYLAPVPFVESVVAARALARCGATGAAWLRAALDATALVTVALQPATAGQPQLVPAGAVAGAVVGRVGDDLMVVEGDQPPPLVPTQGAVPLAWWDLAGPEMNRHRVASGPAGADIATRAVREWKLLMAAAQVGIADGALGHAVDYARERLAFGAPIGSYQGVSHPLVDSHIGVVSARRLVWKAAWFADHEPDAAPHLIPMAFTHACRTAVQVATVAVHTQGGLGVTLESDVQLYFRRAKGWAAVAGGPTAELGVIADALYGPASG
jgi:alkylation response protein AidB-like acyl-CoA dehydrogenase